MASVALLDVTKSYGADARRGGKGGWRKRTVARGGVTAVRNLTVHLRDREFVVLLGPSGCGKTTTLRLVAGLEHPDSGEIRIAQRRVNEAAPKDRDVALVFQNYALYPHLSVFDNIAFALRMRRTPKEEIAKRVADVAARLHLDGLLHRMPHEISGGQQQRVALGRAMAKRPSVYLFDEPLANLDAQLRVQTRLEIKRMQRDLGMTALYVTHDQREATALADRVVLLADGRVQQAGSPRELFDQPANRFVAGFLGVPPGNFLEGELTGENGTLRFDCPVGRFALPDRIGQWARRPGTSAGRATTQAPRVALGVRPEHVALATNGAGSGGQAEAGSAAPAGSFKVEVVAVEPFGDRQDVHVRPLHGDGRDAGNDVRPMVASVASAVPVEQGGTAWATLDLHRVMVFEPGPFGANLAG